MEQICPYAQITCRFKCFIFETRETSMSIVQLFIGEQMRTLSYFDARLSCHDYLNIAIIIFVKFDKDYLNIALDYLYRTSYEPGGWSIDDRYLLYLLYNIVL